MPKSRAGANAASSKPRRAAAAARKKHPTPALTVSGSFPIIAIGASAGGLEALQTFLKHVPEQSGLAFVVVQHLSPSHKGFLVELLQRSTPMPVLQVSDGMPVRPDHVFLIPPNKDMTIADGVLHLQPQTSVSGLRLPIDFFFRSLAADQQERCVGVLLSGMGSDGTLGMAAIKEKLGATFVQSPAKFDGMPRSAVDAGVADVAAPADELPDKIIAYIRHTPPNRGEEPAIEETAERALEKIYVLLRNQTGSDFSSYKKNTIYRRIERRMGLHQITSISNYVSYLRENPRETDLLLKELLIGVTTFFRDPAAWQVLANDVLPQLLRERQGALRAWVPGCSTGEEAYSLAIVFKEAAEQLSPPRNVRLQIFATDLDKDAIEKARLGLYPPNIAVDVSPERLARFFHKTDYGFRIGKEIREMVMFAPQNLVMDPPFTKLDLLTCRNLLIYLSAEVQKRLMPLFHYSLNPDGILFLGSAETVGSCTDLFTTIDSKARLYRRGAASGARIEFPTTLAAPAATASPATAPVRPAAGATNLQSLAEQVIVQRFAPASVLTNEKGDILYFGGRTGNYLEPAAGRAQLNVFAMAREGLRLQLVNAFRSALRKDQPVTVRNVAVGGDAKKKLIHLSVEKLDRPQGLRGTVMIVFEDAGKATSGKGQRPVLSRAGQIRLDELEQDLQHALEDTQSTREEMQTSQEELRSTNEELQSTNEELQSSNEELTTSKEEMQSLNEELQTLNHELQAKVEELSRSNNDMKNLLNSTDIATLFLDGSLNVRRFTPETTKIIKLLPSDAGRPITDISCELDYADLAGDAREVLRTLISKESIVSAANGHWYVIRILPYRTIGNVIDGVVITFTDITAAKLLETGLRDQAEGLRRMTETLPNLLWSARPNGSWDYLSPQWVAYTGISEAEQLGYGWCEQLHSDDQRRVKERWKASVRSSDVFEADARLRNSTGGYRWFRMRARPLQDAAGAISYWYGSATDVEDLIGAKSRPR